MSGISMNRSFLAADTPDVTPPHSRALTPVHQHLTRDQTLLNLNHKKIRSICCIGAGYVGGPTSAVLASRIPGITVTVVDLNAERIAAWNSDILPIYEPKLAQIVKSARDGIPGRREPNLFFTTKLDEAIAAADMIFVSVNTPTKRTGIGAGRASDLSYVESAARKIAEVAETDKIVVEKSTVPCRTAESVRDILAVNGKPGVRFDILCNPEFLAEGTAISDLLYPDRILIGSQSDDDGFRAAAALADLYAEWVPRDRIVTMNLWSTELAKLAANALLAQRISSINTLSAICEATGAEINEVSYAVGLDSRIGPAMLKASVGFGGSCFKKDILSLVYLSESLYLPEVAAYWKSVVEINEWQKDRFAKRVVSCLHNTLTSKKVAILGFSYKKNTGDTRESAAITIVNDLVAERAKVTIYDPQVRAEQIWEDLWSNNDSVEQINACVTVCKTAYDACFDAHAVVIVTEWDEFKVGDFPIPSSIESWPQSSALSTPIASDETATLQADAASEILDTSAPLPKTTSNAKTGLDWGRIAKVMRRPMFVFDGRNIVDVAKLEALGFRVECIGNARSGSKH